MTHITTERLIIGPPVITQGIIKKNVRWLNDPEVVRYSEQRHNTHTVGSQIQYIDSFRAPSKILLIALNYIIIGTMTAHVDSSNSVADVGIMIGDRSAWGKGYGYEAWKGLCDHLLENGIRKIEAGAMSENRAMIKIFRKYKMEYEGRRSEHFLLGKELVDMVLWGKCRD